MKNLNFQNSVTSFVYQQGEFRMTDDGVYYVTKQDTKENKYFICDKLKVLAKVRDKDNNSWGKLLAWQDDDSVEHTTIVYNEMIHDINLIQKQLLSGGLKISFETKAKVLLQSYIAHFPTNEKIRFSSKMGWFDDVFVLSDKTITNHTENSERVIFKNECANSDINFQQSGSLESWIENVAKHAEHNVCIVFAISVSFASPLLKLLNIQGFGFHLCGTSGSGKTTALNCASSVYSNPKKYAKCWHATGNALANTAYFHNDLTLVLDEIGQANIKDIYNTIYTLSNGVNKSRMQKSGGNSEQKSWNIHVLSSGEVSAKQIMQENGETPKAGQEVRLLHIDANRKFGIFDELNFAKSGAEQANILKAGYSINYGNVGLKWLEYLVQNKEIVTRLAKQMLLEFQKDELYTRNERVAEQFAVAGIGGEIATQAGLTGWKAGTAMRASKLLFKEWLEDIGDGNIEENEILRRVHEFLQRQANRFQRVGVIDSPNQRAGFYEIDSVAIKYFYIFDATLIEIYPAIDIRQIHKALDNAGWLRKNDKTVKYKLGKEKASIIGSSRVIAVSLLNMMKYYDSDFSQIEEVSENIVSTKPTQSFIVDVQSSNDERFSDISNLQYN